MTGRIYLIGMLKGEWEFAGEKDGGEFRQREERKRRWEG